MHRIGLSKDGHGPLHHMNDAAVAVRGSKYKAVAK
jgi:hypothetical protein